MIRSAWAFEARPTQHVFLFVFLLISSTPIKKNKQHEHQR
jgi:hypothetical protein